MDDALSILKLLAYGGGPPLAVWVAMRMVPPVLQAWQHYLDWKLKYNQQKADLAATHGRLMIEQRVALDAEQQRLMADLRAEVLAARTEIRQARVEVAEVRVELGDWMKREHDCRQEVHGLRNEFHTVNLQYRTALEANAALKTTVDKSGMLLRTLERTHPEWFQE